MVWLELMVLMVTRINKNAMWGTKWEIELRICVFRDTVEEYGRSRKHLWERKEKFFSTEKKQIHFSSESAVLGFRGNAVTYHNSRCSRGVWYLWTISTGSVPLAWVLQTLSLHVFLFCQFRVHLLSMSLYWSEIRHSSFILLVLSLLWGGKASLFSVLKEDVSSDPILHEKYIVTQFTLATLFPGSNLIEMEIKMTAVCVDRKELALNALAFVKSDSLMSINQ